VLGTYTMEDHELNATARSTARGGATTDCNVCSIGKLSEDWTRHQSSSEWHTMLQRLKHLQTVGCLSNGCPLATETWHVPWVDHYWVRSSSALECLVDINQDKYKKINKPKYI
jgi:hypothetical protein